MGELTNMNCARMMLEYRRAMKIVLTSADLDEIQGQAPYIQILNEHAACCPLCAGLKEEMLENFRLSFSS
jgi:hypothetical protein